MCLKQVRKKILILGVNGFIGHHLTKKLLADESYEVYGLDISSDRINQFLKHERFHFCEGDISINKEWIEYHVKKCDVILPLVAIANPLAYVKTPLKVFELDFESNLPIVRACVKYGKRLIFPSTSEVYGMSGDSEFNPHTSNLVTGPISKQRWIYSCSKQMMDRIIYAYGESEDLDYTLFRPFNWYGPGLDKIDTPKEGGSRVITQFIGNLLRSEDIVLVNGGDQRRCFTYIDDGIDALFGIIDGDMKISNKQIYNIGSPSNDFSIKELAEKIILHAKKNKKLEHLANKVKIYVKSEEEFYGEGYQDVASRVPYIGNTMKDLKWNPTVTLDNGLVALLDYVIQDQNL